MGLYTNNRLAEYTGSSYAGDIKNGRMEGNGTYCFASGKVEDGTTEWSHILGTKYVGELLDGKFHGKGTLYMTTGAKIDGVWEHGKIVERNLTFKDGLKFDESDDWEYCQPNDR